MAGKGCSAGCSAHGGQDSAQHQVSMVQTWQAALCSVRQGCSPNKTQGSAAPGQNKRSATSHVGLLACWPHAWGSGCDNLNAAAQAKGECCSCPPATQAGQHFIAWCRMLQQAHVQHESAGHPVAELVGNSAESADGALQPPSCGSGGAPCRTVQSAAASTGQQQSAAHLGMSSLAMLPKPTISTVLPYSVCPRGTPSCWR